MNYLEITVFTTKPFNAQEIGLQYFSALEQHGFHIEKVGTCEPIRQPYSIESGINAWIQAEKGCYVEGQGMVGKAGGIIGKSSKPRFFTQTQWWNCPEQVNLNWVSLSVSETWAEKKLDVISAIFKDMINIFQASFGFVGYQATVNRQHVTGTLKTRLPGVFWLNYYGPVYVNFFSEEKIMKYAWIRTESINGGLLTVLSNSPRILLDSENLEQTAKEHLGEESFGDIETYRKNPRAEQRRSVPTLT